MIFEAILRALCDDILRTLRALAITIALVLVGALALTIACAPGAHAQVPADAARYKLELRRQAQLVWGSTPPSRASQRKSIRKAAGGLTRTALLAHKDSRKSCRRQQRGSAVSTPDYETPTR